MSTLKVNKIENTATTDGGLSIDSSGRLLIATATNSSAGSAQFSNLQVQGNSSDNTGGGSFSINLGNTGNSLTNNGFVGGLYYASTSGEFAAIETRADGTCGSDDYPGRLMFSTTADGASSPTERMRITSGGAVLINALSQTAGENLRVNATGGSANVAAFHFEGSDDRSNLIVRHDRADGGTSAEMIAFLRTGGNKVGSITGNGSSTSYNTSSDYRLKENITEIADGITRVKQLKPSRFNFIDIDTTVDGFIAHEAQTVVPEAVVGEKDAVDEDDKPIYQGIDQSKLVPLLTAALQEAITKIETLEAKVAALEAG